MFTSPLGYPASLALPTTIKQCTPCLLIRLHPPIVMLSSAHGDNLQIANQLEVSLQQPCRSPSRLAVAQLSATALLAVQPDAFSCSQLGMRLLGALVAAPLRHLTPETMRLSQFCWCWVSNLLRFIATLGGLELKSVNFHTKSKSLLGIAYGQPTRSVQTVSRGSCCTCCRWACSLHTLLGPLPRL